MSLQTPMKVDEAERPTMGRGPRARVVVLTTLAVAAALVLVVAAVSWRGGDGPMGRSGRDVRAGPPGSGKRRRHRSMAGAG